MTHTNIDSQTEQDFDRVIAVVSYITVIGWFVAIVMNGSHKSSIASFHLRQSLGLIITFALLSFIPLIGWLASIFVFIYWPIALFHAVKGDLYCVPVLGKYYQEQLRFIS